MYNKKSRRIFNFDVFCTPIKIHFQWMLSLLSPNDFLLIGSYRRRSWKHTRALHVQQKKPGFRVFFSQNLFAFSIHLSIWKVLPDDIRKLHSSVNIKSKNDMWKILWFWSNSQNVKASRKPFEFWLKKLTFSGNTVDPWLCPPSSWLYKLSLLVP